MSGGGGGGGSSYEPGDDAPDECAALVFTTILSSPKQVVINKLSVGDVLTVKAKSETGPVVAITNAGEEAGSITHRWQAKLLRCLNDGNDFEAEVNSLDGGRCDVEVRPA